MLTQIVYENLDGNKLIKSKVAFSEKKGIRKWFVYQKWKNEQGEKYYTVMDFSLLKFISKKEFSKTEETFFKSGELIEEKLEKELGENKEKEEFEEDGTRGDCLPRTDGLSDKDFRQKLDKELDEYISKDFRNI